MPSRVSKVRRTGGGEINLTEEDQPGGKRLDSSEDKIDNYLLMDLMFEIL